MKLALALTAILALSGCALTEESVIADVAFRHALAQYIGNSSEPVERANRIREGVKMVESYIKDDSVTFSALEVYVKDRFNYHERPLQEQLLVEDLIQAVKFSLSDASEGRISADTKVQILEILDKTRATAGLFASRS